MFDLLHPLHDAYLHAVHDREPAAADRFRLHPYGVRARQLVEVSNQPVEACQANLAARITCTFRPVPSASPQPCC